jgi:hypothetical protein
MPLREQIHKAIVNKCASHRDPPSMSVLQACSQCDTDR